MGRKKITEVLSVIFGWGAFIAMTLGAASFLGFLLALMIGGESGQSLAIFLQDKYFPWVIRFSSFVVGSGLVAMYAGKEQALSLRAEKPSGTKQ